MKKTDLKSGMVVELRDWKEKFILINDALCSATGKDFLTLSSYDDDLKNKISSGDQLDIVEIYKCKYPNTMSCFIENKLELIWKREEVGKEVTYEEIDKLQEKYCYETFENVGCDNCKYRKYSLCEVAWVMDNYNVTRK